MQISDTRSSLVRAQTNIPTASACIGIGCEFSDDVQPAIAAMTAVSTKTILMPKFTKN
jgi:hypothetical protein